MTQNLRISPQVMDALMPMHLVFAASGHITHAGPTIAKMADKPLKGRRLWEVLELSRPRIAPKTSALLELAGRPLHLRLREDENSRLRGMVVPLPAGGGVLNLSLGVSVRDAVATHGLSGRDFSPCDPTVELLYLVEAKSAVLNESRELNTRLEMARKEAETQAVTDKLTGLHNRRAMDRMLGELTAPKRPASFGLMHLDLDFFKAVNDTKGHAAGDHVLIRVAEILRAETRKGDLVARVGGDEFVLIFLDCVDVDVLNRIAARIIERLEEPITFEGDICRISGSIGTTVSTFYDAPNPDRMLSDADEATYVSKNNGRACVTMFDHTLAAVDGTVPAQSA